MCFLAARTQHLQSVVEQRVQASAGSDQALYIGHGFGSFLPLQDAAPTVSFQ